MGFVLDFINLLATILSLAIIARILFSWFRPDPYNPVYQFLFQFTEPVLAPIRNLLPTTMGLDFSPMIALILIQIIQTVLIRALA